MIRVRTFGDEDMLAKVIAEQAKFYEALWRKSSSSHGDTSVAAGAALAALVALGGTEVANRPLAYLPRASRARRLKEGHAVCVADQNGCTIELLANLALDAPDTKYPRSLQGSVVKEWADSTRKLADRHARIAMLLEERLPADPNARALRGWAIDELLGSSDPRKWDPHDVALILLELRADDEPRTRDDSSHGKEWRVAVFKKLLPMGGRRIIDIVGAPVGGIPDPGTLRFEMPPTLEHFPGEFDLYAREWLVREKKAARHTPGDWKNFHEYVSARWVETDDAAPHPELDMLRKAFQKLRSAKAKK